MILIFQLQLVIFNFHSNLQFSIFNFHSNWQSLNSNLKDFINKSVDILNTIWNNDEKLDLNYKNVRGCAKIPIF